jgi:hypothetical protein
MLYFYHWFDPMASNGAVEAAAEVCAAEDPYPFDIYVFR